MTEKQLTFALHCSRIAFDLMTEQRIHEREVDGLEGLFALIVKTLRKRQLMDVLEYDPIHLGC